ncbi:hypothetical protein HYV70_05575 [Candidatus Uhrbacteria bacterium]|nr:hypothetical protein [Candidatus Uhrbacteria bacterium]
MIDPEVKIKFLEEVAQTGNICVSCRKVNIVRSTIYRWKKGDKEFAKKLREAEKLGRENLCDLAEHSLALLVKEKNLQAIKYVLTHNSKRYRPRYDSKVILEHRSPDRDKDKGPAFTLEDMIDRMYGNSTENFQPYPQKNRDNQNVMPPDQVQTSNGESEEH